MAYNCRSEHCATYATSWYTAAYEYLSRQLSVQMAALVRRQLSIANAAVKRRPLFTAITVSATKAALADLMVQTLVERQEKVDMRRTALFGSFGALYQGCFQYG